MSAIFALLSRLPAFDGRGVFATLFAEELRVALARDKRRYRSDYLWG